MNDRPMRQVSLRKFRDDIAILRDVVEVSRRDNDGHIRVLGFWTPYKQPEPEALEGVAPADGQFVIQGRTTLDIPVEPEPHVIRTPDEATAVAATIPGGRPFPKEAQTGRRKGR